jgi:hypothetical protein
MTTLGYSEEMVPFGQQLSFSEPLAEIRRRCEAVRLDAERRIYSWELKSAVQISLSCSLPHLGTCARDGDVIRTLLVFASDAAGTGGLRSAVTIETRVQARVSRNHSTVRIVQSDGKLMIKTSEFMVELTAVDTDGLPVASTQPTVSVDWCHTLLPEMCYSSALTRVHEHGNVFKAAIPIGSRSEPGEYHLRVAVTGGWDEAKQEVSDFLLLEQTFVLEPPSEINSSYVLAGGLVTAAVLVGGLIFYVKRRFRQLKHVLILATKETSLIVFFFCTETADMVTDGIGCYYVMNNNNVSQTYKIPYLLFATFALISGLAALSYRLRSGWKVRQHLKKLDKERELLDALSCVDARRRQVDLYKWDIGQGKRHFGMCALAILNAFLEGAFSLAFEYQH